MRFKLPNTTGFDLIILTLIIGCFFGIFLGHYALVVPDEGRYAEISREMAASGNYLTPYLNYIFYFEKPPCLYWLVSFSIKIFGLSEWAIRLWNSTFGVLGCLIVYLFGRKFFNRKVGIYAALILATSILYFIMGHSVTPDMIVSIWITASLSLFLCGAYANPLRLRYLYFWSAFACAALAVLTKGLIGILFPMMIVGTWILLLNKWHTLKQWPLISSSILFLLIATPWHVLMQIKHPMFFHFYFIEQHLARYFTSAASREEPIYFCLTVFVFGFFPWSAFMIQSIKSAWPTWKERKQYEIEIFLMIWIFEILIFFSLSNSQLIPYILPIFPPTALLVGRYFVFSKQSSQELMIGFAALVVVAFIFSIVAALIPHYYPPAHLFLAKKYLILLSTLIIAFTLIALIFYLWGFFRTAFFSLLLGMIIFCLHLLLAIPDIDHQSTKPLAQEIMQQIKPGDEVVAYDHYYQDLPFYTRQRVIVVDCLDELDFGAQYQNVKHWMISKKEFRKQWHSNQRLFAIIRLDKYNLLHKKHPELKFYELKKTQRDILVSNQPTKGN